MSTRPSRASTMAQAEPTSIDTRPVITIIGNQATTMPATAGVRFRPIAAPMMTWPTRRPANGANGTTPPMAKVAVTISGASTQASGIERACAPYPAPMELTKQSSTPFFGITISDPIPCPLFDPQQVSDAVRILQLVHVEDGINQGILLLARHDLAGELAELIDNVLLGGEVGFAAARRLAGFGFHGAVLEVNLDAHLVTEFGAQRGDRRILQHFDTARQRDALRVVDAVWEELIDEHVAFQQQGRDTERQVKLSRGQTFWAVRPADVVGSDLRAVDHNFVELVQGERPSRLNRLDRIQRSVVTAHAGIELQRNTQGLELLAQAGAERVEIEAVLRAGESGAETTVGRFEHINDAGEAVLGQQRTIEAALRGAAGVHALDHGPILGRHQACCLSAGDTKGVHRLLSAQAQTAGGTGSGREHAHRGAGMPALADMLLTHANAHARADLVTGDGGGEKVA